MRALRLVAGLFVLLAGLFAAFLCSRATDPYLRPLPGYVLGIVVTVALLAAGLIWYRRPHGRLLRLAFLAWIATPVALASALISFDLDKRAVLEATPEEVALLGPHFITGYDQAGEATLLAQRGLVGGLFLTRHNVLGRTTAALRDEVAGFQALRRERSLPSLIVAADQEGGIVSHLSPPLSHFPSLSVLADLPADERRARAIRQGEEQGRELAAIGVTLDLAPVVDLQIRKQNTLLDFESRIAERAISADPEITGAVAVAFAQGLHTAGIGSAIKHFPGLGRVDGDTHHFRVTLDASRSDLETSDWLPFRAALDAGQSALMVGHVVLSAVDPDRPASHSKAVIQGLIRDTWHHQGLIISDDMVMSSIYQHGLCTAVTKALNAGVDLLLVAYDGRQYYKAMACALTALHHGELDRDMLAQSAQRLAVYRAGMR